MSHFGWVNTYQSVIVPGLASAFGIFFMRQYMHYIPDELLNAARVDGGNYWTVYWRIIIPVSWPALSVLGILTFVAAWNNYLWPLVMLRSTSMQPIVLGIASVPQGGVASVSLGAIMAGATCAVVPLLIVYIIFQRKIVSGLMRGAIQ
jgi:ABC-type glycerol-3-phosphate transport system permease component